MIQELLYTSHEGEGLRKGSGGGFCTVLSTNAMAPNLAQALEKLSGYKHPFDAHDSRAPHNPVNYRFTTLRIGGKNYHVFSRVSDFRAEHTGRTNKLAHHLVADASLRPDCGPTAILASPLMRQDWDGKAGVVPPLNDNALSLGSPNEKPCQSWAKITGDAGWAGLVAEKLFAAPERPISVIFPVGSDPLALVSELFALIPATFRWEISFSTYFTTLPPGTSCRLRFLMDQTSEAEALRRDLRQETFDLIDRKRLLTESTFTEAARAGVPFRLETPGHARHQSSVMIGTRAKSVDELELGPLRVSDGDLVEIPSSFSRRSEVPVAVELPSGRNRSGPPELPNTSNAVRDFSKSKKDSKWRQGLRVGLAAGLLVGLFGGFGVSQLVLIGEPKSSGPSFAESKPSKSVEDKQPVGQPEIAQHEKNIPKDGDPGAPSSEADKGAQENLGVPAPDASHPDLKRNVTKLDDNEKAESGQVPSALGTASAQVPGENDNKPQSDTAEPQSDLSTASVATVPGLTERGETSERRDIKAVNLILNGVDNYTVDPESADRLKITRAVIHSFDITVSTAQHGIELEFSEPDAVVKAEIKKELLHSVYEITFNDESDDPVRYFYDPDAYEPQCSTLDKFDPKPSKFNGLKIRVVSGDGDLEFALLENNQPAAEFEFDRFQKLVLEIRYGASVVGEIALKDTKKQNWRFLDIDKPGGWRLTPKSDIDRILQVLEKKSDQNFERLLVDEKARVNNPNASPVPPILPPDVQKNVFAWDGIRNNRDKFDNALKQPVLEVYLPAGYKRGLPERVVFQYSILKP
ncbi:MAG: hypothetical protein Q8M16_07475 [Pirellulaceae bacterium]|nr:hypothetical protein [Pirellulaceae bacterium]